MALNKLRQLDQNSMGVTIPKDDLRLEGLVDENGEPKGEHRIHIQYLGEGKWKLEILRK